MIKKFVFYLQKCKKSTSELDLLKLLERRNNNNYFQATIALPHLKK